MPDNNPYKTTKDITAELTQLAAQVDSHRFVIAWLLKQIPHDAGRHFLSTQANIFDTEDKSKHAALIIEELDSLREHLAVLDGGVASE